MLRIIRKQGFDGRIVTETKRTRLPSPVAHHDLRRIGDDLQSAVDEAKRSDKPLLITFSAPG